jgi:hypothetical protein
MDVEYRVMIIETWLISSKTEIRPKSCELVFWQQVMW